MRERVRGTMCECKYEKVSQDTVQTLIVREHLLVRAFMKRGESQNKPVLLSDHACIYHTPSAYRQSSSLCRLSLIALHLHAGSATFMCLFVCLFVEMKPEKLYSTCCVGREVNPLGAATHGQRHKPRACQRQRHTPRTCQSMVSTLQVDGLARNTGLTSAPKSDASSATETAFPHALYNVLFLDGG